MAVSVLKVSNGNVRVAVGDFVNCPSSLHEINAGENSINMIAVTACNAFRQELYDVYAIFTF